LTKRRLVAIRAVAMFWHIEFLALVPFNADATLVVPAVPHPINATRFDERRMNLEPRWRGSPPPFGSRQMPLVTAAHCIIAVL
jgi:hypothetical protein